MDEAGPQPNGEKVLPSTLYVVPTPIGNLADITYRAIHILRSVDLIAAEDTRTTRILLDRYGIQKSLLSFFSHNETKRIPELLATLEGGKSVALVSDAGTPGVSDPAYALITAVIAAGYRIVPLPGPTACIPALVASGLPTHRFAFEGFLPQKKGRQKRLSLLKDESRTLIFYESPHRILRTLEELEKALGDRNAAVGRELTKHFEELVRGTLSSIRQHFLSHPPKGEFVIVVAGSES